MIMMEHHRLSIIKPFARNNGIEWPFGKESRYIDPCRQNSGSLTTHPEDQII